jgi:hypothetical protein
MSENRFVIFRSQILNRKRPKGLIRINYVCLYHPVNSLNIIIISSSNNIANNNKRFIVREVYSTRLIVELFHDSFQLHCYVLSKAYIMMFMYELEGLKLD